ncbi:MAG: hypothetical protein HZA08_09245 [Nitrospirae bacterium]|nr:hypothetical protein [Nitrospirota bacterium]
MVSYGENQRDKKTPPILNLGMDRRGFLTPPEELSYEAYMERCRRYRH